MQKRTKKGQKHVRSLPFSRLTPPKLSLFSMPSGTQKIKVFLSFLSNKIFFIYEKNIFIYKKFLQKIFSLKIIFYGPRPRSNGPELNFLWKFRKHFVF
jgi:hypothetical protein